MYKTAIAIALAAFFGSAQATGGGEKPPVTNDIHPSASAGAVANSKAIAGAAAGAVAGGGAGGSVGDDNSKSSAYALGLSLTTSQGDCPVLGSFNIAFIGATYPVQLCHAMQAVRLMNSLGMSRESVLNLACSVDEIRAAASECRGK